MIPFLKAFDTSRLHEPARTAARDIGLRHFGVLQKNGFDVSVSRDLHDMADFWRDHGDPPDMFKSPVFDPFFQPHANERNTLLCFLEKDGKRIGTCGYRTIELRDPRQLRALTLRDAFEDLWYFYEVPELAPTGETCVLHPIDIGRRIRDGLHAIAGALWIKDTPETRGVGAFKSFGKLSRLLSITVKDFPWQSMIFVFCPENRKLAQEQFGVTEFFPKAIRYRSADWDMAWASWDDIVRDALA